MNFIDIEGNQFLMGSSNPEEGFLEDYEYPPKKVRVKDFQICDTPITNKEFQLFVKETNYVTVAEKQGYSFVFEKLLLGKNKQEYPYVAGMPWWRKVIGADWAHPYGAYSGLSGIENHPVVHVSLIDALEFCNWANTSLPTESQWEFAARAGTKSIFTWGDSLTEGDRYHANTWQGEFPIKNTKMDGYLGTAPVYTYEPNNWGLYQMIGNVWEWCRNPRYAMLDEFNVNSFNIEDKNSLSGEYAIRGGSFLCHCSYCNRYRVAARNGTDFMSTSSHLGFRCIRE